MVAVTLVALLIAVISSYAIAASYRKAQASQSCGVTSCIPGLEAATVAQSLTDKGHLCDTSSNYTTCEIFIGDYRYEAALQTSEKLITAIRIEVFGKGGTEITPGTMAYLRWFATLPYRDDSVTAEEVSKWVSGRIAESKDAKATIADYEYVLTHEDRQTLRFTIEGAWR